MNGGLIIAAIVVFVIWAGIKPEDSKVKDMLQSISKHEVKKND